MILSIPDVLSKAQIAAARKILDAATWVDGRVTAGPQSAMAKENLQLPVDSAAAREVGDMIFTALGTNALFLSAAMPDKILPPLFNRYQDNGCFGIHIDNAIRQLPGGRGRLRTDLSCTLFFTEPDEYDGGDLVIEDVFGAQRVKLPAGHMVLYPSTSLHQVTPVTRGARTCAFFWLQSMIRSDERRAIMFDLDQSIQTLARSLGLDHPEVLRLSAVYHNLVRMWAEL